MTTYLPYWSGSSVDVEQVCRLLKVAFQRKLLFTIRDWWFGGYKVMQCKDVSHHTERMYVLMVDKLIKAF